MVMATERNALGRRAGQFPNYGEPSVLNKNGMPVPRSKVGNRYLFQGRRFDKESGLYYYRNRMMSSELGRFLQRDPLHWMQYVSDYYAFVEGNPVIHTDHRGLYIDPTEREGKDRNVWEEIIDKQNLPELGDMKVSQSSDGFSIIANIKDECCDEINFLQWYDSEPQGFLHVLEEMRDIGWRQDKGPDDIFYVSPGSHHLAEGGEFGKVSTMTDAPGAVKADMYWKFITCAVCARGTNRGKVYTCKKWKVFSNSDISQGFPFYDPAYEDFKVEDISVRKVQETLPAYADLLTRKGRAWKLKEYDIINR